MKIFLNFYRNVVDILIYNPKAKFFRTVLASYSFLWPKYLTRPIYKRKSLFWPHSFRYSVHGQLLWSQVKTIHHRWQHWSLSPCGTQKAEVGEGRTKGTRYNPQGHNPSDPPPLNMPHLPIVSTYLFFKLKIKLQLSQTNRFTSKYSCFNTGALEGHLISMNLLVLKLCFKQIKTHFSFKS